MFLLLSEPLVVLGSFPSGSAQLCLLLSGVQRLHSSLAGRRAADEQRRCLICEMSAAATRPGASSCRRFQALRTEEPAEDPAEDPAEELQSPKSGHESPALPESEETEEQEGLEPLPASTDPDMLLHVLIRCGCSSWFPVAGTRRCPPVSVLYFALCGGRRRRKRQRIKQFC